MIPVIETNAPTTVCDAPPTVEAAAEFAAAMDDYKRRNGRPFPTWSEVLEVLCSLGYAKADRDDDPAVRYRVRVTRGGAEAKAIAHTMPRLHGTPLPGSPALDYGFRSESDRVAALRAIRGGYGWTSVEAVD